MNGSGGCVGNDEFPATASGTPNIYYDQRLASGEWPPVGLGLPLTMISVWNPDSR